MFIVVLGGRSVNMAVEDRGRSGEMGGQRWAIMSSRQFHV